MNAIIVTDIDKVISEIVGWTSDILTILVSSIILHSYFKIKNKATTNTMMIILSIGDLFVPLTHMIGLSYKDLPKYDNIFFPIIIGILHFSLYWALALALFVYLVFVKKHNFHSKPYIIKSLIIVLILAPYCSLLYPYFLSLLY